MSDIGSKRVQEVQLKAQEEHMDTNEKSAITLLNHTTNISSSTTKQKEVS